MGEPRHGRGPWAPVAALANGGTESKRPTLDFLTFIVNTLRNQDKKVASIQVYEYGSLARYSEYMKTCHKTNIIVQTKCGYASSLNGKTKIPNKTVDNITRALLTK